MTALQSLSMTNKALQQTQARISTGLRVSTASDNAAYWSIATTMKSDNQALSAVQDALGLGAGKVDTAYTAINDVITQANNIKAKLVAAQGASQDDQKKIAADIQKHVMEEVTYIPLGQYEAPSVWRTSLKGVLDGPATPIFWNIEKTD